MGNITLADCLLQSNSVIQTKLFCSISSVLREKMQGGRGGFCLHLSLRWVTSVFFLICYIPIGGVNMLLSIEVLPTYFHFLGNRNYPPRASPFKFLVEKKRHIGGKLDIPFMFPSFISYSRWSLTFWVFNLMRKYFQDVSHLQVAARKCWNPVLFFSHSKYVPSNGRQCYFQSI